MSEKGTFYCDASECKGHGGAWDGHRQPPIGFLTVDESGHDMQGGRPLHFCSWDCVLKYAAAQEPVETIPWTTDE